LIPTFPIEGNKYVIFFILTMEKLLKKGNIMVRIKHFGITSKLLSWLLNQGLMEETYMDKQKRRSC
jgi:hypothetical protein